MKTYIGATLMVMMTVLAAGVTAPGAATLETLQQGAYDNRDLVRQYQADLDIAREQVREARGEFLPSLDLGYTLNRLNHDTAVGETRENDSFTAGATWNVFAGFKDYYTLKAAQTLTHAGEYRLDSVRQDIGFRVALDYLEVYRGMENLKVAESEVKLYEDRLKQIRLKVKVGVLKKTDLLKVKVEMDNALQNRRRTEAAVATAVNRLGFETGTRVDGQALEFSLFDQLPDRGEYPAYEKVLLGNRSELNALRRSLEASGMRVAASKASLYPKADLKMSYASHTRDDFFADGFENSDDEVRCQAVISMNLFDGMKKYAVTSRARLEQKKIGFEITELEEALKTELKNTLINLDVAFDNLEVAKAGTAEAQENLRVTDLGFGQGLGTSSDVLDAILNLSRARFNLISAYTEVFENDFRLKRLVESF
ncbi:MAG: TolC family protein [Desulfobacteraceae bacterium]|nr:TolC family protein [Desulfobacteraceae bacterium]